MKHFLLVAVLGLQGIYLLSGAKLSCAEENPASRQIPTEAALIPMRLEEALKLLMQYKRNPQVQFPDASKIKQSASEGGIEYIFDASDGTQFDINALTGDVDILYRGTIATSVEETNRRLTHRLPEVALRQQALKLRDQFFPDPTRLNVLELRIPPPSPLPEPTAGQPVGGGGDNPAEVKCISGERTKDGVKTLNRCFMRLRRDTGDLEWFASRYRKTSVLPVPSYSQEEALAIARWSITQGKESSYQILLLNKLNAEQGRALGDWYQNFRDQAVQLEVEEDPWLHQRLTWKFMLNVGAIWIDAHTGQVVYSESSPIEIDDKILKFFQLQTPEKIQRPPHLPQLLTSAELAEVKFGSTSLAGDLYALHYPPIIRSNSALIYADYFPAFLISVTTKDGAITLQGQLKDKGKQATLKIGDKQATVDGKTVELAAAPVTVDGRLYLPAELLQQVNGIPIRWEPKKKLLWVETRYLRRD